WQAQNQPALEVGGHKAELEIISVREATVRVRVSLSEGGRAPPLPSGRIAAKLNLWPPEYILKNAFYELFWRILGVWAFTPEDRCHQGGSAALSRAGERVLLV
ncbi:MAG: hypothetical protein M1541_03710, partial [Acidobacteria bacterium]|nr:hypothetical protein [Acidobacteriota bacterium]